MRRLGKLSFILFVAFSFILSTSMQAPFVVNANDDVDWKDFGTMTTEEPDKEWRIKFSTNIDEESVNESNVQVKAADDTDFPISVETEDNIVTVSPEESYEPGKKYSLYIGPNIKSGKGQTLKDAVKFNFEIEEMITELESPKIYPSENVPVNYNEDDFRLVVHVPFNRDDLASYDEAANESSVKLYFKEDEEWTEVGSLFDSGNLDKHADEIAGDGFYSIKLANKLSTEIEKDYELKVEAELANGHKVSALTTLSVVETSGGKDVEDIVETYGDTEQRVMNEFANQPGTRASDVKDFIKDDMNGQDNVDSVKEESDGTLEITYKSGLRGMIQIVDEEDTDAGVRSATTVDAVEERTNENKKERTSSEEREATPKVPVSEQTTGDNVDIVVPDQKERSAADIATISQNQNEIGSRNVLLWAPFSEEFAPWNEEDEIESIFNSSELGFTVSKRVGTDADIESLKTISNYGFVLFSTHGAGGKWLLTGEPTQNYAQYEIEQILGQVMISQHYIVSEQGGVSVKAPVYAVNDQWFEYNIDGTFNNTVIYNNSCEGTMTDDLWDVFSSKGAGTYYGYDDLVSSKFATEKSIEIVENLVANEMTTGDALVVEKDPYYSAEIQLKGNASLKYPTEFVGASNLVNGNFEQQLQGWQTVGDGRVISGLGSPLEVTPTEGKAIGIISTGLGYTTSYGSIQQTFYMGEDASTISFDWNYVSEEFLEWIGDIYQDPFIVTLSTAGYSEEILHLTVDEIAEQFGTQYTPLGHQNYLEMGGDLVYVSPQISFDRGDVWMTDWQSFETSIPNEFKGKVVTIKFEAEDEGDTEYDTAVLLDDIRIE